MSSNNNNNDASTGIALIFGAMAALALVAFAIFAFFAFVLTILAIFAWNKPLHLGRNFVIEPAEAHAFIGRGLVGMWVVPAFALFVNVFLGVHINWNYLTHMMAFGYVAGSLGIEIMMADQNAGGDGQAQRHQQVLPPQTEQRALPPAPREPFHYASWDDEEENRR